MDNIYLVLAALASSLIGAGIAQYRNRNPYNWGALCFVTSFLGIGVLLAMPTVNRPKSALGRKELERWHALVALDPEIRAAAETARGAGREMQLAEKYLLLDDRRYLQPALDSVLPHHSKSL